MCQKSFLYTSLVILFLFCLTPAVLFAQEVYDLNKHLIQPEYEPIPTFSKPTVDAEGNLNLSISLGTVEGRGINYPVSISYQSGIKVTEPANWIGLGWSFNPGAITRIPGIAPPDLFKNPNFPNQAYPTVASFKNGVDVFNPSINAAPDVFSVMIPGKGSVEMVQIKEPNYTSTTTPAYSSEGFVTLEHKAWKIEYQISSYTVDGVHPGAYAGGESADISIDTTGKRQDFSKFLITTEDGTRYLFGSPTLAYTDALYQNNNTLTMMREVYAATWRLLAIFGSDYQGNTWSVPTGTESGSWLKLVYGQVYTKQKTTATATIRQTQYLSEIVTPVGKATFQIAARPEPMLPLWERSATNWGTNSTQKKLTQIKFYKGTSNTSTVTFTHDNSFNPFPGGRTSDGRLKLKSIAISGENGGGGDYSFTYNANPTIYYSGYNTSDGELQACIDEFGFYNKSKLGYVGTNFSYICELGINSNANSEADSWSLESIIYPTGLKDVFTYETRSVSSNSEVNFYWNEQNGSDSYRPDLSIPLNTIVPVYYGGPRLTKIERFSGFDLFAQADQRYEYEYSFGVLTGIPDNYFKRKKSGTESIAFSSSFTNARIVYGRVNELFYPGLNNGYKLTRMHFIAPQPTKDIFYHPYYADLCYNYDIGQYYQCKATFIFAEREALNIGERIMTEWSGQDLSGSESTNISYTNYGTSDQGRTNRLWSMTYEINGSQNAGERTIELKPYAKRITSTLTTLGDEYTHTAYEYDLKTNLMRSKELIQGGTTTKRRVSSYTFGFEKYPDMLTRNMLSQIVRTDVGEQTGISSPVWKSSNVTTWRNVLSTSGNPNFWKPWKSFSWKSASTTTTSASFNEWSSGNTPSNWVVGSELKYYDANGNIQQEILSNGSKVDFTYGFDGSKLTNVSILEGGASGGTQLGIQIWYDNAFRKVSRTKNQNNVDTYYAYDGKGRLSTISNHNNLVLKEYDYDYGLIYNGYMSLNRIRETIYTHNYIDEFSAPSSYIQNTYYDGLGNKRQVNQKTDGGYLVSQFDYDQNGYLEKKWNPYLDANTGFGDFVLPATARSRATQYYRTKLGLAYDPKPYTRYEYFDISKPKISSTFPAWTNTEYEIENQVGYSVTNGLTLPGGITVAGSQVVDELGNISTTIKNHSGEVVRSIQARGSSVEMVTDFEYDEVGNLIKSTSPEGFETTYTYNSLGQKTKESLPDQEGDKEFRYDDIGRLRFVQDPNQKSSKQDLSHHLTGSTSVSKTIVANSAGKLELDFCVVDLFMDDYTLTIKRVETNTIIYQNTISPEGDCVGMFNNPLTFNVTAGTYTFTGQALDPGEPIISTNGTFGFVSNDIFTYTKYDDLNRPVEIGQYSGGVAFNSANVNDKNFPVSGHDPQIKYYYDGDHPPLVTGYTPNNANGQLTKISYRDQSTTSSWSHEAYSYNELGLIEWKISDINGLYPKKLTSFNYDDIGRLIRTDYQPTNSTDRFITWNEYDDYGRLQFVFTDTDTNTTGRQKEVEFVYNPDGTVLQKKLGNNTVQTVDYAYGIRGWLDKVNNPSAIGNDKFALGLSYTANGNISQQQWRQPQLNGYLAAYNYTYDAASRLKTANFSGSGYSSYAYDVSNLQYDDNGNIKSFIRNDRYGSAYPDGYIQYYYESGTNRLNYLLEQVDYINYDVDHDANGNMTKNQMNGLSSAQYDWRGLASQMIANGSTLFYAYDANGKRTKKKINSIETHYVRGINGEVLAVYENDVIKMHNIYAGGDMIGNYDRNQRRYFLKDHLGSIRTTVDQNGAVDGYTDYYPFGKTMPGRSYTNQATALNANKYTGHERDEEANLTLDYMLARNYDPNIGRFLQIDPYAAKFPNYSPYNYTLNNPLRFVDPDGKAPTPPDIILLHNEEGAGGYGHNAVLIGNDTDGWKLYSKNGEKSRSSGEDDYQDGIEFATLADFEASNFLEDDASSYDIGIRIETTSEQDKIAQDAASEDVKTEYGPLNANCATTCAVATEAVGKGVGEEKSKGPLGVRYTDPKKQVEKAKQIDGAKVIKFKQKEEKNDN